MAATYNPYEAPRAGYEGGAPAAVSGGAVITPLMVEHLRGTKGWVQLLSVFSFIGAGFMMLGGVGALLVGMLGPATTPKSGPAQLTPLVGVLYIFLSVFYLFPGVLLHRFAGSIDAFLRGVTSSAMEDVLDKSRAFWKAMGVMVLAVVVLTIVAFVGAIVVGIVVRLSK